MDSKDISINDSSFSKLMHNDVYYKAIFKKTEKIVSVVFYILHNIDHDKKTEAQTSNIASKAHLVHEHALRSLDVRQSNAQEVLEQFTQALIALDSTLKVALVTHVISREVHGVVAMEIASVLRSVGTYMDNGGFDWVETSSLGERQTSRKSASASTNVSSSTGNAARMSTMTAATQPSSATDRRERIKTIIEAKGEASIKEISDIIIDCSEKTIQRELGAMIEDGVIKRQGERRWSRYSIQ